MGAPTPFTFRITSSGNTVEIELAGYIDVEGGRTYQREVEAKVQQIKKGNGSPGVGLLYIDDLSGFQAGQVARQHGEWFLKMRPQVSRIAIVSPKASVTMAISIAKLLSKTPLRQFKDTAEARAWLLG
jgi:SpoIIAA-like